MIMSQIVYKSKNVLVIYKPAGIPTQKDLGGDADAITLASRELCALGEESTLYPIHRLDRVVGGLLVFARNKKSAAALSALVSGEGLGKEYIAVAEGEAIGGELTDYLRKDSRLGRAVVSKSGAGGAKLAVLEYSLVDVADTERGKRSLVKVVLKTGRFHQIRAQFSSRGMPLVGDKKYGSRDAGCRTPALFATSISFTLGDEVVEAQMLPELTAYPWNLFNSDKYK